MAKKKKNVRARPPKSVRNSEKEIKKVNPFELKVNSKKHDIVGQRKKTYGSISTNKAKTNEKRREFLKKVNLHRNKANGFVDKRIGEYDSKMHEEDRVLARIAEGQRKQHKKRLYNLNDDFDLTHDGEAISNMETFGNVVGDSDEDDDEAQLNAEFVSEAHFGGFLTKKDSNAPKTRKEILNDFITESKMKKQEKKEAKEQTDELTVKLDEAWKQLHTKLPDPKKNNVLKTDTCDPFDLIVKELKFEPRGSAVITTRNAVLINEKRRKKLEEERISRMHGNYFTKKQKLEDVSVEAIDDDFEFLSENLDDAEEINDPQEQTSSLGDTNELTLEPNSDDASNSSDVETDGENDHSEEDEVHEDSLYEKNSLIPQTLEDFSNLVSELTPDEISSKIDSIVSICRFKTNDKNLQQSKNFFCVLLQFIDTPFKGNYDILDLFHVVAPHIYTLAQKSAVETGEVFRNFFLTKIAFYQEIKHKKNFEFLNILTHLKLCSLLYSTSDFRHPVATIAMVLMSDMLTCPFRATFLNTIRRVFVCHLIYEYVSYSKRFVPEAVNYLFSVLDLATDSKSSLFNNIYKLNLNTPNTKKILLVTSIVDNWEPTPLRLINEDSLNKNETHRMLSIIHQVVSLIHAFAKLYQKVPIFVELFRPASDLCSYLPVQFYPASIVKMMQELKTLVTEGKQPLPFLTFPNKKPKLRKLFTPRYECSNVKKPSGILENLKLHKQLSKKIKKEEKGVIREHRRDAEFEARERLRERMDADDERKRKVKELYAQLATQEGEYKSLSKRK